MPSLFCLRVVDSGLKKYHGYCPENDKEVFGGMKSCISKTLKFQDKRLYEIFSNATEEEKIFIIKRGANFYQILINLQFRPNLTDFFLSNFILPNFDQIKMMETGKNRLENFYSFEFLKISLIFCWQLFYHAWPSNFRRGAFLEAALLKFVESENFFGSRVHYLKNLKNFVEILPEILPSFSPDEKWENLMGEFSKFYFLYFKELKKKDPDFNVEDLFQGAVKTGQNFFKFANENFQSFQVPDLYRQKFSEFDKNLRLLDFLSTRNRMEILKMKRRSFEILENKKDGGEISKFDLKNAIEKLDHEILEIEKFLAEKAPFLKKF